MPLKLGMQKRHLPADTFGDRFELASLPLPRRAAGYAVQMLDTDTLLDQGTQTFLPIRSPRLTPCFSSFDAAHQAASHWLLAQGKCAADEHSLAIVPIGYDTVLERYILIYGVLRAAP